METNNSDNYVLVLEDRSQTQSASEAGKLSVVSSIDQNGKINTVEPLDANSAAFMKFKKNDSLFTNFFSNLARQFKEPSHFGVYRLVADKVEDSVGVLKKMLENRDAPANKSAIDAVKISADDFAPAQKTTAINAEEVDWKEMERLGLSQEKLEQSGDLEKILNWQKSNLMPIAIPFGDGTIYTEARIALRHDEEGKLGLAIHTLRKEPQLDFPYMGYRFSDEDKETLRHSGNLGKVVELTPKNGEPFKAYISVDPQTNELVALKADRVNIPQEIKGVLLTPEQYKDLSEGKPVKVEGMLSRNGKPFDATLQVNAARKGIEFIFDEKKSYKQRNAPEQKPETKHGIPGVICGLALTEKQQQALSDGKTLYLKNMTDKEGQSFNAYVRMDKEQNRPRFYRWNPDKKEGKVEAVAEENKTQVAVNNEGKTNEATKNVKEPLKSGQTQPDEKQQVKQEEKEKQQEQAPKKRGRRM
ncbi:MAG TPA: hypothetical protein DIC46_18355 [Porphyromonadaceae bacterium]|jgi:hypothetical protein|nr:hypothetical protein [Porphyromonadaceae bacterium]